MKDYLVILGFNLNGVTVNPSFHRAENENAALAQALLQSIHPAKLMAAQSVQEVHPDFCVLNHDSDVIASKEVIAMKVKGLKKSSDLTKDLIKLAKKHSLNGIVRVLTD